MREDGEQKHCQGRNLISWRGSVTQHYDDDLQRVVVIIRGLVLQPSKTIGGSQTRCHNHTNPADVSFGAKLINYLKEVVDDLIKLRFVVYFTLDAINSY